MAVFYFTDDIVQVALYGISDETRLVRHTSIADKKYYAFKQLYLYYGTPDNNYIERM